MGWAEKVFHNKSSQKAQNATFRLASGNAIFHKRAILLLFLVEFIESVLDVICYPESTMGPPWLGPEKNF